jgi:hypothetical protein
MFRLTSSSICLAVLLDMRASCFEPIGRIVCKRRKVDPNIWLYTVYRIGAVFLHELYSSLEDRIRHTSCVFTMTRLCMSLSWKRSERGCGGSVS